MAVDMMDIDIDMGDLDADDMGVDDTGREHGLTDTIQSPQAEVPSNTSIPIGPADPESRIPVPNKIHLRGLDNFTPKDLEALAMEYYSSEMYQRIEWIDDSSANLVYSNDEVATEALKAFAAIEIGDMSQVPLLQMIPAKAFPGHPETVLQVRLAVLSDKKLPGAHERSKFYLFNPEYERANRRNTGYRQRDQGPRRPRDLDDPRYESGRRNRRRRDRDEENGTFDGSLYDDDEISIISRSKGRDSQGSFSSSEGRHVKATRRVGKELFPERAGRGDSTGRLRNRSSSPARDRSASPARYYDKDMAATRRERFAFQKENKRQAQLLKENLRSQRPAATKELFPHKATHRRSDAFDAADETADLFAHRMAVPFTDGGSDDHPRNGSSGFSIRGAAKQQSFGGFAIKGAASGNTTKELFPARLNGSNAGKELFSSRLEGRGNPRRRAEDLFY